MENELSSRLVYRKAIIGDLDSVLSVLSDAAMWLKDKGSKQWGVLIEASGSVLNWVKEGVDNEEFFIITCDSVIIGTFRLQFNDSLFWDPKYDDNKAVYLHSFAITSSFRGKELGVEILSYIEKFCLNESKKYLRLDCDRDNKPLIAYYKKNGFEDHSFRLEKDDYKRHFMEKVVDQ